MEIKDMAEILLKGGKMLNRSCPKCNAPLFQYQGRTFCPRCGWEAEQRKPSTQKESKAEAEQVPRKDEKVDVKAVETQLVETVKTAPEVEEVLSKARAAVLRKISEYSEKLSSGRDWVEIEGDCEAMSELVELLEKIMKVQVRGS